LQEWTVQHPRDALAWQTLAQLQAALQQPVLSARAEAEARWAQLDLSGALERFRSAQRLAQQGRTANHYELSILDARVRQVETELREQLCDDARRSGDPRCQRMIDAP
jgi:predicted Zn-dependent protease